MSQIITLNEALHNRKKNMHSTWFNATRSNESFLAANRLREDFVKISVQPTFTIDKSQAIFTMGSCFARRLENALHKKEVHVPMFEGMIQDKEMFPTSISFNKYNTYSMLYEFEWALGSHKLSHEESIVRLNEDCYSDLQSVPAPFNEAPLHEIIKRKETVFKLTKSVLKSKTVVLTLGLNEVWYDNETDLYLNMTPDIKFASRHPNRFELRILGVEENILNLNKIYTLLSALNEEINIIITVSPVPLLTTFSTNDIVVANMLSKSILVAVAHEFSNQHENVNYFPSYEIALLSSKKEMWEEDLRHISDKGAHFIIDTFLQNYLKK